MVYVLILWFAYTGSAQLHSVEFYSMDACKASGKAFVDSVGDRFKDDLRGPLAGYYCSPKGVP